MGYFGYERLLGKTPRQQLLFVLMYSDKIICSQLSCVYFERKTGSEISALVFCEDLLTVYTASSVVLVNTTICSTDRDNKYGEKGF